MAILTELRDPRVQNVTVVGVEVTPDMREAKVLVSVMGNEAQQRTVLKGLQNSVGFLQSKISDRIETRYIPRLTFVMDEGVKKSVAVQQILEQISKERESNPTSLQIDPPVESSDGLDEQVESETSNDSGGNPLRAT